MDDGRAQQATRDPGSVAALEARLSELEHRLACGLPRAADAGLAAVLGTGIGALCTLDAAGTVVYASSGAQALLGPVPGEAPLTPVPNPARQNVPAPAAPWCERLPFARVMASGQVLRGARRSLQGADGSRRALSIDAAPVRGPQGEIAGVAFSLTDVTELVGCGTEGSREGDDWLRGALEAAQVGTWSWNVETGELRGSAAVGDLLCAPGAELGGTFAAYLDRVHPKDRRRVVDGITATVLSDATSYSAEHRVIRTEGGERWVEVRGRVRRDGLGRALEIYGTVMDVTRRKTTELVLRGSEEAFRTLVETVPSYIVSVARDRSVRFLNRALPRLSIDDVIGEDVLRFIAEESRDEYAAALERVFVTGELQELEGKALVPDGDPASLLLRMGPVKKGDTVELVTVVGVDVTEVKRTEEALRESQEQLRVAQRLESVGRLAGGVAHDFNNLLTVVTGCVDLLEAGLPVGSDFEGLVQPIRDAAQRGASLTRQLLAFARKQVVRPQVLDLNRRIRDAADLLQRLIGEDVELCLDLAPDLWPVEIDPVQFEQVLVNLAVNAQDAMPTGGRLTVESRNVSIGAGGLPGRAAVRPGDWIELSVSDTGHGIRPEQLPFLFEPFYTTKPAGEGTGLGLATCFGIVRQAGGHIDVDGASPRGARFLVLLPRSSRPRVEAVPDEGPREITEGRGTVLLVEDDPAVRRVTRAMLSRAGYELLEAENGEEGLERFQAHSGSIDLVITDVVMPRLGGTPLARRLLELDPDLRVLLVSGYSTELGALRRLDDPRVHVLQKPYSAKVLTRKLREIGLPLGRRR